MEMFSLGLMTSYGRERKPIAVRSLFDPSFVISNYVWYDRMMSWDI